MIRDTRGGKTRLPHCADTCGRAAAALRGTTCAALRGATTTQHAAAQGAGGIHAALRGAAPQRVEQHAAAGHLPPRACAAHLRTNARCGRARHASPLCLAAGTAGGPDERYRPSPPALHTLAPSPRNNEPTTSLVCWAFAGLKLVTIDSGTCAATLYFKRRTQARHTRCHGHHHSGGIATPPVTAPLCWMFRLLLHSMAYAA